MEKKTIALMFSLLILFYYKSYAQDNGDISIDAQLRTRAEYNNGAKSPRDKGQSSALSINDRARLSVTYERPLLTLKFTGQQTGLWGDEGIKDQNTKFGVHEAWAKIVKNAYFLQVGRQTLVYDDERLLGALDWHVVGNHHDALRLGYNGTSNKVHLILADNNVSDVNRTEYYSGPMPYKNLEGFWYHYSGNNSPFQASLTFLNIGLEGGDEEKGKTYYQQTFGTYLTFTKTDFHLNGTLYLQTGKDSKGTTSDGILGNFDAAYDLSKDWTLNTGIDYLSGNKEGNTKNKAFNPLFGTHHKFYGAMDLFYATPWINNNPGLIDAKFGVRWKTNPKLIQQIGYHYFATAVKYSGLNKTLGHEIDYQINWKVANDINVNSGYSFVKGTETLDFFKGGNHKSWQDWAFVQLNISPRLFSSKKNN